MLTNIAKLSTLILLTGYSLVETAEAHAAAKVPVANNELAMVERKKHDSGSDCEDNQQTCIHIDV